MCFFTATIFSFERIVRKPECMEELKILDIRYINRLEVKGTTRMTNIHSGKGTYLKSYCIIVSSMRTVNP